ncbi:MAG: restriction endonuclease subunit S, partial [Candidatus Omnitrophica bacterium]|nr:restriction endonuclease subunit S [Candidatus Omnitrophota bacterium]
VPPEMAGWNISREVAMVPADASKVDPYYLAYWIATRNSQDWLTGVKKGAAYTGINIEDLRNLPVSHPDKHGQKTIVQKLDALAAETRRLEAICQRKLDALAELKQSLFQRAFAGEL